MQTQLRSLIFGTQQETVCLKCVLAAGDPFFGLGGDTCVMLLICEAASDKSLGKYPLESHAEPPNTYTLC